MKKVIGLLTLLFAFCGSAFAAQNVLTWTDNSTNEDGFIIVRKAEPCADLGQFSQLATVGTNIQTYTDTAVVEGQFYCYAVLAFNATGVSAPSNLAGRLVPVTPAIPAAPSGLQVQ